MTPAHWRWRGMAGHLIVSDKCCFHLVTDIGEHRISTVGCYHPKGVWPGTRHEVGSGRLYETMVFAIGEDDQIVPAELDADGYNDEAAAEAGHLAMCHKWDRGADV